MGPTRDDFEIWKGVKSIAAKLSQVHNRKIYSFILRLIPGPGPNLSLSTLPPPRPPSRAEQCGAADQGTTSMSMTRNYLNTTQSRQCFWTPIWCLAPWIQISPLVGFLYITRSSEIGSMDQIKCWSRACVSSSLLISRRKPPSEQSARCPGECGEHVHATSPWWHQRLGSGITDRWYYFDINFLLQKKIDLFQTPLDPPPLRWRII